MLVVEFVAQQDCTAALYLDGDLLLSTGVKNKNLNFFVKTRRIVLRLCTWTATFSLVQVLKNIDFFLNFFLYLDGDLLLSTGFVCVCVCVCVCVKK